MKPNRFLSSLFGKKSPDGQALSGKEGFPVPPDHPNREAHLQVNAFLEQVDRQVKNWWDEKSYFELPAVQALFDGPAEAQPRAAAALVERLRFHYSLSGKAYAKQQLRGFDSPKFTFALGALLRRLLLRKLPFSTQDLIFILQEASQISSLTADRFPLRLLANQVERVTAGEEPSPELKAALAALRDAIQAVSKDEEAVIQKISLLLGTAPEDLVEPGEPWSDCMMADLEAKDPAGKAQWLEMLKVIATASGGKPSQKWLDGVRRQVEPLGEEAFLLADDARITDPAILRQFGS